MHILEVHVPDEPLLSLKETPEQFAEEMMASKLLGSTRRWRLAKRSPWTSRRSAT
jgi:hypothetical protein